MDYRTSIPSVGRQTKKRISFLLSPELLIHEGKLKQSIAIT